MPVRVIEYNGIKIARVESSTTVFQEVGLALDLMASVRYETTCDRMVVDAAAIDPRFFDLSSGLAGDILQKFVTYSMKLAIIGDFSQFASTCLRDFIYESNRGDHVLFLSNEAEAIERLSRMN